MVDNKIVYRTADSLPIMDEVTDSTYALVEENGTLKRVSGSSLGGSGIKTAIIKSSAYDNALSGMIEGSPDATYSCINMTFEEARQTMTNGEPLQAICMDVLSGCMCVPCAVVYVSDVAFGVPIIGIFEFKRNVTFYWTADGISTTSPEVGGN